MELVELIQSRFVWGIVLFFDVVASVVILVGGVRALIGLARRRQHSVLTFMKHLNFALAFILGGEVVKITAVQNLMEILSIACIIVIHGAISFLIRWEMKNDAAAPGSEEEDINL